MAQHANRYFGGERGIVVTLMDVWVIDPQMAAGLNLACWTPIDHDPPPPQVLEFFANSGAIPIAMTRHGQRALEQFDPLYVPHGVDAQVFKPHETDASRKQAFPEGAFVVGIVAANKGRPSRKSFAQSLMAFKRFCDAHDNVYLYLHTTLDPNIAGGENLPALLRNLAIPQDRIRIADQYTLLFNPYSQADMGKLYSAMDVLLNPAMGEGFGIPVLEAAACGTPSIVTDFTAMTEVCGPGWKVKHTPYWTGLNSWQAVPDVDDIVSALEDCYAQNPSACKKLASDLRRHALDYDVRKVVTEHFLPALEEVERRIDARTNPSVPGKRKHTVSVVTPWYNHPEFAADYWDAIQAAKPDETIVIDSGSDVPVPEAAYRFDENVGFSRSCNLGLEFASGDVVVFLNNDIRLTRPDWLDSLLAKVKPGTLVGAQLRDDDHAAVDGQTVPYLDGWCLAGMREDFERIGAWDETYKEPSYYGDNDLSVRAVAAGMRLVQAYVGLEHLVSATNRHRPLVTAEATQHNRVIYEARVREARSRELEKAA